MALLSTLCIRILPKNLSKDKIVQINVLGFAWDDLLGASLST
jgi:hypothetical protein